MGPTSAKRGQLGPTWSEDGLILGPTWADVGPNLGPTWLDFRTTLHSSTKQPEKWVTRRTNPRREEARKRSKKQTPRRQERCLAPVTGAKTDALKACNAHFLPCISARFSKRKEGRKRSPNRPRRQLRSKSALESPRTSIFRPCWAHFGPTLAPCWSHVGPKSSQELPRAAQVGPRHGPWTDPERPRSGPGPPRGPRGPPGGLQSPILDRKSSQLGPMLALFWALLMTLLRAN